MPFDAFLQIEGVPGESTDENHSDWIEILSYSHGVSQPGSGSVSSGGARRAARSEHLDFSIVKALDKATPKLNLYCCDGTHVPEVKIELCQATGTKQKYMEYKMSDVLVSSVRPGGSSQGGDNLPLEEITFNYGKVEWTYTETDLMTGEPIGDISTHWDLRLNTGG